MKGKRILLAHNRYKYRGGEDIVFDQESKLLTKFHKVYKYIVENEKELKGFRRKLQLFFNTYYSKKSYKDLQKKVSTISPDLVHVHNFFPLITPAIFDVCKDNDIPSVLTLHNYRLFHPNGLFLTNSTIDERGLNSSAYHCIKDKVYRDSYLQTAVVAHMIEYHKKMNTWKNNVNRFIALTEFAKSKFIEGGVPERKIRVKPNFIEDPVQSNDNLHKKDDFFIFIGRISREKGIETLVETWKENNISNKIYIFGNGPLFQSLKRKTKEVENIIWMGQRSRKEVFHYLKKAKAMLFPSVWFEGFPMTIVEALAMGTPLITTDIGSQAEIIKNRVTGLKFKAGSSEELYQRIIMLIENSHLVQRFSRNARQEYLSKYTWEKNIKQLNNIYEEIL